MRLAFVSHSLPPKDRPLANVGGMQRVAAELLSTLESKEGITLHVSELRSSWTWIHVKVFPFLVKTFFQLRSLVRSGSIDTILFSSMVSGLLTIPLQHSLRRSGVRSCVIVHGLDITSPFEPYQALIRKVYGIADAILPVSAATGEACTERGLDPEKLHVVHNGINIDRFEEPGDLMTRRRNLAVTFGMKPSEIPPGTAILCSVGRHVKRKGFAWFIANVMPALPDHVHYWLAGDGPEFGAVTDTIKRHGLEKRVRLLGMLSDPELRALYPGADLFIMPNIRVPNDMEGFGIVMLESGLNGTPAIAARIEGILEVIKNGENGELVPSGDAGAFVNAIKKYLSDPSALEASRQRARRYTVNTFGWETIADRYITACQPPE